MQQHKYEAQSEPQPFKIQSRSQKFGHIARQLSLLQSQVSCPAQITAPNYWPNKIKRYPNRIDFAQERIKITEQKILEIRKQLSKVAEQLSQLNIKLNAKLIQLSLCEDEVKLYAQQKNEKKQQIKMQGEVQVQSDDINRQELIKRIKKLEEEQKKVMQDLAIAQQQMSRYRLYHFGEQKLPNIDKSQIKEMAQKEIISYQICRDRNIFNTRSQPCTLNQKHQIQRSTISSYCPDIERSSKSFFRPYFVLSQSMRQLIVDVLENKIEQTQRDIQRYKQERKKNKKQQEKLQDIIQKLREQLGKLLLNEFKLKYDLKREMDQQNQFDLKTQIELIQPKLKSAQTQIQELQKQRLTYEQMPNQAYKQRWKHQKILTQQKSSRMKAHGIFLPMNQKPLQENLKD